MRVSQVLGFFEKAGSILFCYVFFDNRTDLGNHNRTKG